MKGKMIRIVIALLLIGIIGYSGYQIWATTGVYRAEAEVHQEILQYKPPPGKSANPKIIELQGKNSDVVGWLTVPNTEVDHPFVQSDDNDFYLHRDINKKYLKAGTLFIDSRCDKSFSDFNTIIYGHNMKNDSMFGSLKRFKDQAFFNENKTATIFLPYQTYTLDIFAYLVTRHDDKEIYSIYKSDEYFEYVKKNAKQYREIGLTDKDHIVTLSTCSYEFENARIILLSRIKNYIADNETE